jgi:hypothetical protein
MAVSGRAEAAGAHPDEENGIGVVPVGEVIL